MVDIRLAIVDLNCMVLVERGYGSCKVYKVYKVYKVIRLWSRNCQTNCIQS